MSLYLTDWEYGEGEVEEAESDSDDNTGDPRQLPESEYDFYRLSNLDFEMMTRKSQFLFGPWITFIINFF